MNTRLLLVPLTVAASIAALSVSTSACRRAPPSEGGTSSGTSGTTSSSGGTSGGSSGATSGGSSGQAGFDKLGLLRAVADCSVARTKHFEDTAVALRDAGAAHGTARTEASRVALEAAWKTAMASWQEVEIFRFGPAASSTLPGGADLRDQIYAFPLFNRCKVEEQMVAKTYETPAFATSLVVARGLHAVEYVTFYKGTDNACSPTSAINANGTWAALGEPEIVIRKADYAKAATADLVVHATALAAAWNPAAGNFHKKISEPGSAGSPYPTSREALNAVSDGLFYFEKEVKDIKLARPLGVSPDCAKPRCPETVESPFSKTSTTHLRANLTAFRRLFQGCADDFSGIGFDDWLRAVGAGDLADKMIAALDGFSASITALGTTSLEDAIATEPAKADALYTSLKALTDVLKTDFVTVLDLELPKTSEGDND